MNLTACQLQLLLAQDNYLSYCIIFLRKQNLDPISGHTRSRCFLKKVLRERMVCKNSTMI